MSSNVVTLVCIVSLASVILVGAGLCMKKQYMDTPTIKTELVKNIKTVEDLVKLFPTSAAQIDAIIDFYIKNTQKEIQAIIDVPANKRTFANTAFALDRVSSFSDLPIAINAISMLENLSPDKDIRDAAHKAIMRVGNFYVDSFSSNKKLFEAFKAYVEGNAATDDLTSEQRYFLKENMDDFIRAGLNLPQDTLDYVGLLKKNLSELTLAFSKNIAQDNRTIEVDIHGLKGVDPEFVGALKKADNGSYLLGTDYPTRSAIMENCAVEDTRRRYFELCANQGYPENDTILKQVFAKRDQVARLLGFDSFAALDTADQMVKNPVRAYHFLHDLIKRAEKKEAVELDLWLADMPESVFLDAQDRIKRWDMNYLQNQYKKKHLSVDEEEIACYFPMKKTVKGLLDIYRQFLSIDFKEIPVTGLWHPEVTLIGVYDRENNILGYLFMDLYPRDNKYTHAAHATIIPAVMGQDGARVAPAVSVVMANFPKSTASKPALLKRQDVSTFFHEFGHALHALCGATQMASFSGTS
ncbi:MAG: M3 family metallopeptidase, partial [Candidatus Dependentiae bacterium]|nr:M3 family metallopeptidase [Candidatus Dependentiae bacterium]